MSENNHHSENRSMKFLEPSESRRSLKPSSQPEARVQAAIEFLENGRNQILERFPSETEELNLERVDSFIAGLGLDVVTAILLDKSRQPELEEFLLNTIGKSKQGDEFSGLYIPSVDLAFVFRDREAEKRLGVEFTESLVVHEKAHGSSHYTDLVGIARGRDVTLDTPRMGQVIMPDPESNPLGVFIEEGFCEVLRGKYITEVLGNPNGFSNLPTAIGRVHNLFDDLDVPVPTKFVHKFPDGKDNLINTSYAGAAMDFLIEHDGDLLAALIKARKDPNGLREVAMRLDAVRPGLYKALRDGYNHPEDFYAGLKCVSDVLELTY